MITPPPLGVVAAAAIICLSTALGQTPAPTAPAEPELPWPDHLPIPPSPALTPEEEQRTFQLAPGFRAELVAAEPLIGEPVAMAFDERGRIWVVEMRGYMPNIDGTGEDAPNGRIVILEDTDSDGCMDKSTAFLEGLVMPRALLLRKGGAVIAEPPALYWCPDENQDGVADSKTLLHPTYCGVGNPEHMPNGLLPALDNWIYNAKSNERFRFNAAGEFLRERTLFRGQWGITQDDWGRLFYNYNSDQLRGDLLPERYLSRNSNFKFATGANVQVAKNQDVFPIRVTPGVNRAYRNGMLRDGKLIAFTAASGPVIYRGELFPSEFSGNSFVPEPSANLIKRNIHTESQGNIEALPAYPASEFMASTDERFRPVNLSNGPDGALYVVDMYRGVVQHITYVSPWMRRQVLERGLEQPLHQGRIWRIVPEATPLSKPVAIPTATPELVRTLSHANGWRRDTAQRLLVEKRDPAAVPLLEELAKTGPSSLGRLHALWTLEGMEAVTSALALSALADSEPKIRATAIRLLEPSARRDPRYASALLALRHDFSTDVLLQLLLSVGDLPGDHAQSAIAEILPRVEANPLARTAVISSLKGRELEFIERLLAAPAGKEPPPGGADLLAHLARCVVEERKPDRLTRLLEKVAVPTSERWHQLALLEGLGSGSGAKSAPGDPADALTPFPRHFRVRLEAEPPPLAALLASADPKIQEPAARLAAVLTWPGKPGEAAPRPLPPLSDAQKAHVAAGQQLYAVCAACHQVSGQGQEGLAPPLAGSEWVTGSEAALIRIVLHGVGGPMEVAGKAYNLDMPGLAGALNDEQVAQILSYIRQDWGNQAPIVEATTVARIREGNKDRGVSWTAEELSRFP